MEIWLPKETGRYFQRIFIVTVANLKCLRVTLGQIQELHKEKEPEKM